MLLPETREREALFKLAIRMGFPIFLLSSVLIFSLLSQYLDDIPSSFIVIGVGVFAIAVYFSFYLIYKGYDERITDPITHMFTREYSMNLFKKEIEKGPYTFVLMSLIIYRILMNSTVLKMEILCSMRRDSGLENFLKRRG